MPATLKLTKSSLEDEFARQLKTASPVAALMCLCQHRFHPHRQWRFDFCWTSHQLAVEIQGGLYQSRKGPGGHNRGAQMEADYEKLAEAALLGWTVVQFGPKQVKSGYALNTTLKLLGATP